MITNDNIANLSIPAGAGNPAALDPFDPANLRLSQDFVAAAGVKKVLNTVPCRKPSKEWFVQTHPSEEYRLETFVIELKEDGETYLVDRPLWSELVSESTFSPRALITSINRQGVVFFWPVRLPGADGRIDDWSRSSLEAALFASGKWVRVQANMSLGAYELFEASGTWASPTWDVPPISDLLRIAFKDRFIKSMDHPILKRLRGEG